MVPIGQRSLPSAEAAFTKGAGVPVCACCNCTPSAIDNVAFLRAVKLFKFTQAVKVFKNQAAIYPKFQADACHAVQASRSSRQMCAVSMDSWALPASW
eukprot:1158709-Pelagomonas_calceolata.AAC.4